MGNARYEEKKARVLRAIHFEKQDRIPASVDAAVVPLNKYVNPEFTVADAIDDIDTAVDTALQVMNEHFPEMDVMTMTSGLAGGKTIGAVFLGGTGIPGQDGIPRDVMPQVIEKPILTEEDLERIVNGDWFAVKDDITFNRLGYDPEDFAAGGEAIGRNEAKVEEAGYFTYAGPPPLITYDLLVAGLGMVKFHRMARKDPARVDALVGAILEAELAGYKEMIKGAEGIASVTSGTRANCDNVSREHFERFAWPSYVAFAEAALAEPGLSVYFHMDSRWDDFLDLWTCFPKKRCIFDTDGMTDIYKVHEILGDRMCITGNIGSSLMAIGTPDEVYDLCMEEMNAFGREGFILAGACSLPANAKAENLDAYYAALMDHAKK